MNSNDMALHGMTLAKTLPTNWTFKTPLLEVSCKNMTFHGSGYSSLMAYGAHNSFSLLQHKKAECERMSLYEKVDHIQPG